ncbi:MAG: long-chain fatty acid--CoA ligase [Ginsengibacter sp.]
MIALRLFDCLEINSKDFPKPDMLAGKENGAWKKYSSHATRDIVNNVSAALISKGIGAGDSTDEGRDKVAVIAKNRPEWIMLDMAVQQTGAVLTPIYPTISSSELQFILSDAKVKMVFVNDQVLLDKVIAIKDQLPELKDIYSFEPTTHGKSWNSLTMQANEEQLTKVKEISSNIKTDDLATIIYTSGTTGRPKGVMLSHKNILSNVEASIKCFPEGKNFKALSFLPLNHIFERMITYLYLYNDTAIYYAESLETIAENLREIKPELFSTVPRLLEKVYEKIMSKGSELKGIKRLLFFWAHRLASKFDIHEKQSILYKLQLALANKIIFNKWREALGNNIVCIVSGGAACQVKLIKIFGGAGLTILEGYGLTETSPVISVNKMNVEDRFFGTVGPLIDNVQVKLAEDGEILCKGPNVMKGYYKNPDLTSESIIDGWYKTGDIGQFINGKFLKITDRKKEIFKTSGGKYVAPMFIENKLKESRFIENAMVLGAGQKFVSALIIPSLQNLKVWCEDQKIACNSLYDVKANKEVINFYQKIIDGINVSFNHVEQVKKFTLLDTDWSVETGEMTPKLSLKRKVIEEKYSAEINKLYQS